MSWEEIVAGVSLLAAVCGIVFGYRNGKRSDNEQTRQEAMTLARVEGKLDSIGRGFDDMRVEIRVQNGKIDEYGTRLTRVEETCKSLDRRITGLDKHSGE